MTDAGLETDLVFHHGYELAEFAAFPLLDDSAGLARLDAYYEEFGEIAHRGALGLLLETPTWRASSEWGARVGYDAKALDRVNQSAVQLMRRIQARAHVGRSLVAGILGPRGDGYVAEERPDPDEAADYHASQVSSFATQGVDLIHAMTITTPEEAVGVVRAARGNRLPVMVSFTVEVDGRLPDGTPLGDAIKRVDTLAPPDHFGVNCAHPTHISRALDGGEWQARIAALRPNASTLTHEELDAMETLDEGDLDLLTHSFEDLRSQLPGLTVVGGCCGTDARHVSALWGQ